MKMEKQIMNAIFKYIHVQRAPFSSEKDLRNLFVVNGADGAKFDKLMKSFSVNSQAKQFKKQQDFFSRKGALTGVPTVIVNGKYKVEAQGLDRSSRTALEDDYIKLVNYLLTLD